MLSSASGTDLTATSNLNKQGSESSFGMVTVPAGNTPMLVSMPVTSEILETRTQFVP